MRRGSKVLVVAALFAVGMSVAVVAAFGNASGVTGSIHDALGDSGSGPDISTFTVTVNADQTVTFSVTLANRTTLSGDESAQFFVSTPTAGSSLNIAQFGDGSPPTLNRWNGSSWQTIHYVPGTFSNSTFTTTISLSDLQDALQAPLRPLLDVDVRSYTGATPDATPVQTDAAPDTGWLPISTIAATTTGVTTTAHMPPSKPSWPRPFWNEKIVRLPHARIEWKKLEITHLPIGARVSIACTKGCSLSEAPRVKSGTATSTRFVGHPFAHGQVFITKIRATAGSGWWDQTTIVAQPGGQEIATRQGCFLSDGTSLPLGKC